MEISMTEQAGYMNQSDLMEECAEAVEHAFDHAGRSWVERWTFPGGIYSDAPDFPSTPYADVSATGIAKVVLSVLCKRGLINLQGLELIKQSGEAK